MCCNIGEVIVLTYSWFLVYFDWLVSGGQNPICPATPASSMNLEAKELFL
jgi:hypothetical protein